MWPDRVSNPGPLVHESDALLTALSRTAFCSSCCRLSVGLLQANKGKYCTQPVKVN